MTNIVYAIQNIHIYELKMLASVVKCTDYVNNKRIKAKKEEEEEEKSFSNN